MVAGPFGGLVALLTLRVRNSSRGADPQGGYHGLRWGQVFALESQPAEAAYVGSEDGTEYDAGGHVFRVEAEKWRHEQADAQQRA